MMMMLFPMIKLVGVLLALVLLTACITKGQAEQRVRVVGSSLNPQPASYFCHHAARYRSQVVGTGHCVSLIQLCAGAPLTRYWREGQSVRGAQIEAGTVIATFENGRYPNKTGWHAAIYISQDKQGIWVWDQWVGKPVHKRLIRFKNGRGAANNDGDAYSVVH